MRRAGLAAASLVLSLGLLACAGSRPGAVPAVTAAAGASPSEPRPRCPLLDADQLRGRPASAGSLARGPVRVHYCHPQLRPLAERVLAAALRSYRAETALLGFPPPLPDEGRGGAELDLYLVNLGRGGRAQAVEEPATRGAARCPGYVVIDHRTEEGSDYLASFVAHELNHVLQYALSVSANGAFLESVAAYVDDRLYPAARALPAMVADFQRAPFRPLYHHDDDTAYDYGAALFVSFLVARHGVGLLPEVLRGAGPDHLPALAAALAARGDELRAAVGAFARLRVRTGRYARRGLSPPGWERFAEVALDRSVSPFSFLREPLTLRPQQPPEELGTSYFGLDLTAPLGGGLLVEVQADPGPRRLLVELLSEDGAAPLASAVLAGGQAQPLRARRVRPGARLWLAVTNLGDGGPLAVRKDAAATAQGFSARFQPLPEDPG